MTWNAGDWVVFDRAVGQIKEMREDGSASFSDGWFETSGRLVDRFRPLTLKNKRIVEWFDAVYDRLREIDGEAGFNYPDISRHFSSMALSAIDTDGEGKEFYDKANEFVAAARDYKPLIQGVQLFRPKPRRAA